MAIFTTFYPGLDEGVSGSQDSSNSPELRELEAVGRKWNPSNPENHQVQV
jgi:hypothetical protein